MRCATKNGTTQNWIESNNLRVWIIGGDCLKSQIFLSENRESAFGLVQGYGVFQSREDFSVSLRGINKASSDARPELAGKESDCGDGKPVGPDRPLETGV